MKRNFIALAAAFLALTATGFAQLPQFQVPVTVATTNYTYDLYIGVSGDGPGGSITDNTVGGDEAPTYSGIWEESQLPPAPPAPFDFDTRIITLPGRVSTWPTGLGTGLGGDFRGFTSTTQIDTFRIQMQGTEVENGGVTISWPATLSSIASSWEIKGFAGTTLASTDMTAGTSVTIPAAYMSLQVLIIVTNYQAPASTGPTFSANVNPVSFTNVTPGATVTRQLIITNPGTTNDLEITNINVSGAQFSLVSAPATPITIAAGGGSQTFTVQYVAPMTQSGADAGSIEFTHNDPSAGTLTTINLSGEIAAAPVNTLLFSADQVNRSDNMTGLRDSLSIKNFDATLAGGDMTAIQLFIISNMQGLRLSSVSRGSLISNTSDWGFAYEIANGPINADLSSDDTIKVVIFALNASTSISTGLYFSDDLVKFSYETTDIDADSVDANLHLAAVVASNADGDPLTFSVDDDQVVRIFNQGGTILGDANNDGSLNVLDILAVVDHILGRHYLTGSSFDRANIAPWGTADTEVNAADLALIQSIVLAGQYPDGTILSLTGNSNNFSKVANGNVELIFDVTSNAVSVRLNNDVPVKGIQFDMDNVEALNGSIEAQFGNAYSQISNNTLRTVVYDYNGSVRAAGEGVIAQLPVDAAELTVANLRNVVVADANNNAIENVTIRVMKSGMSNANPVAFALEAAYPNPFNPSTTITFAVPYTSNVTLTVYNSLGEQVRTLVNSEMQQGTQSVTWDGRDDNGNVVSSGMYMYRMSANGFSATRSMLLTK